eukprot:CAMPEP_0172767122 /NCGR_PEP_ID=MMETSP1074-20121228/182417_1 /TAXON_ID=2916 /ORGANISM="Ceratium fusus, Strain PA161109" /LENGTH=109 /DNA_ID=CAMNT_0013602337 /DNA_START=503 /DNA_END=833 /DNA_ORIENTATION=+
MKSVGISYMEDGVDDPGAAAAWYAKPVKVQSHRFKRASANVSGPVLDFRDTGLCTSIMRPVDFNGVIFMLPILQSSAFSAPNCMSTSLFVSSSSNNSSLPLLLLSAMRP